MATGDLRDAPAEKSGFSFEVYERSAELLSRWLAKFRTGDPGDDSEPTENEKLMAGILVGSLSANRLLVTQMPNHQTGVEPC